VEPLDLREVNTLKLFRRMLVNGVKQTREAFAGLFQLAAAEPDSMDTGRQSQKCLKHELDRVVDTEQRKPPFGIAVLAEEADSVLQDFHRAERPWLPFAVGSCLHACVAGVHCCSVPVRPELHTLPAPA